MIRFYNGYTYENGLITRSEVWVDGSVISFVGQAPEELPVFEREINLKGDLIMPGFKNAHTHSAMTFLRSMADDLPLHDWLFNEVFPRERHLTAENLEAFTKVAFLEYLANGITACFDMYYYVDTFAELATRWGFRGVVCSAISANNDPEDICREWELLKNYGPFVGYQIGFHAEYTASPDLLRFISDFAHEKHAPVFSHNSETESEVKECIARFGTTPTRYFDDFGLFDYGGGGFHCVWMSDEDLDIFARRGLYAVTNPCSNAKLASGIMPLERMRAKGVKIAVGTDGPASNNALDFFREMYLANVLAKLNGMDASAGNPEMIVKAAVKNGAHAMGLYDCDDIAVGKQADIIRIDMSRPNMQPVNNILKNLVYSGNPSNVKMTMIAGKILYENGEFFVGEDIEQVYADCQSHVAEMTV